jgi:hypothetical protein
MQVYSYTKAQTKKRDLHMVFIFYIKHIININLTRQRKNVFQLPTYPLPTC